MIRILLLTFALTGCAIMPETPPAPSTDLADFDLVEYQTGEVQPMPAVDIPAPREDGAGVYWHIDYQTMELIDAALAVGHANTQALTERNAQIQAINLERNALLRAGQLAEYQATLYHQLYATEIQQGWLDWLMYRGITGAALILFATGTL